MCGCESWTIKKAEHRRIDAFELWCWRRLLRVPWTARRSNQSIQKEISPGCSLEGLMLKLKLQYLGHLMRRTDSLEKTLMLGGIGGRRRRGPQFLLQPLPAGDSEPDVELQGVGGEHQQARGSRPTSRHPCRKVPYFFSQTCFKCSHAHQLLPDLSTNFPASPNSSESQVR